MLLEAYFVVIDSTLNKLTSVWAAWYDYFHFFFPCLGCQHLIYFSHFFSVEGIHWWYRGFHQHSAGTYSSTSLWPP
jgi:hypothetical protein